MTGPAGRIVADGSEIRALASRLELTSNYAEDVSLAVHEGLGLGDLVTAGVLDPAGAVRFEHAAFDVLTGPFGLAGIKDRIEQLGSQLHQAAADYALTDRRLDQAVGQFVHDLPRAVWSAGGELVDGDFGGAAQAFLITEPALAAGALAVIRPYADLVGTLPLLDGTPTVTRLGPPAVALPAPVGAEGLLANLGRQRSGTIDVQTITGTDAAGRSARKIVVYLPGTKTWGPLPGKPIPGKDVNDLTTNILATSGTPTAYEQGVLMALRDAGATSTDDITLVGHSQGGTIAVNTASTAFQTGEFAISHVLTVAAPAGLAARDLPASTQLLAVENRADLVPRLDGSDNPHRPNITTITIDHDTGTLAGNHDLDQAYRSTGVDLDASGDPAVRAFLGDGHELAHVYQVSTVRYRIEGTLIGPLPVR